MLSQRRAAFDFVAGQVFPGSADDANRIDADVIIEARIVNREDRVLHIGGDFFILQRDTFFQRKLANHRLAVVRIDTRDYAGPVRCERGNFAGRLRIVELVRSDDAG